MIFGSYQEIPTNPSAIPQYKQFRAALRESVTPPACDGSKREIVERIHAFVNAKIAYRPEQFERDEWQVNPSEGDCEDFAITKYLMLEQFLGPDPMRLVIGKLFGLAAHAVLLVRLDGGWVVLDNRYKAIRRMEAVEGFVPLFGLNRRGQWLYIHARSIR